MNHNRSYHFTMAAELIGRPKQEDCRKALKHLQWRHPLLRCRIAGDNDAFAFVEDWQDDANLTYLDDADSMSWEDIYSTELHTCIANDGPLLRVVIRCSERGAHVIVSCHHALADGISMAAVLIEFVELIKGYDLSQLSASASFDDLLREQLDEAAFATPPIPEQLPQALEFVSSSQPPRVDVLCLDKVTTANLRRTCRKERATVHGALSAALLIAGASVYNRWSEGVVRVFTPIDLRPRVGLANDVVLAISAAVQVVHLEASRSFWSLAREISSLVKSATSDPVVGGFTEAVRKLVNECQNPDMLSEQVRTLLAYELIVSNLRTLPTPSSSGLPSIQAIWGPSFMARTDGEQSVGVATFNDSLRMIHTSYDPIPGLLIGAEGILRGICLDEKRAEDT